MAIITKIGLTLAIVFIMSVGAIKILAHGEMRISDFILTCVTGISGIGMVVCFLIAIWMN